MTYVPITNSEVDAKSPIDDNLMGKIQNNFADHESRLQLLKAFALGWNINGDISQLWPYKSKYKRLDGVRLVQPQTFTQATMLLERAEQCTGTLEIDIRKYKSVNHTIIGTTSIFSASINSIARAGSALSTQSIARVASTLSTQSITLFKAALSVASVVVLPNGYARINFTGTVDADWKPGDAVLFASLTSGANNGTFLINRVKEDGGNNIVIANGSAVAQSSAAGTGTLRAYSYNYTNPVSTTDYIVGERVNFASHSNAASDGLKTIYALNSGGNNIVVKDSAGVTQGAAAGNVGSSHWVYSYSSAVSTTDYAVGDTVEAASHSNSNNNGNLKVLAVNSSGNNLVVYNEVGVAQGSAAGTMNTCRWVYALSADPTSSYSIGEIIVASGTTSSAFNDGQFVVKQINRGGTNNLVVANVGGVAQASAAGIILHPKCILSFASDLSAFYSLRSNVEIVNSPMANNNGFFDVIEINRGGGSNYNIVVYNPGQTFYTGLPNSRVASESRSVFSTRPKIDFPTDGSNTYNNDTLALATTAAVFDPTDATVSNAETAANVGLGLDIVQIPSSGYPTNLTVQIA